MTVCDIIAEVDGTGSAGCPQETNTGSQSGQVADADVPVTACGAVVAVDGSAAGSCQPASDAALSGDLPTSDQSQSAPVDGVLPVSGCSVVVAVAGSATNSCEPDHVARRPRTGRVRSTARWTCARSRPRSPARVRVPARVPRRPTSPRSVSLAARLRVPRFPFRVWCAGCGGRERQRRLSRALDQCQHHAGERYRGSGGGGAYGWCDGRGHGDDSGDPDRQSQSEPRHGERHRGGHSGGCPRPDRVRRSWSRSCSGRLRCWRDWS